MSVRETNLNGEKKSHIVASLKELCALKKQRQPASKIRIRAINVHQHVFHSASTQARQKNKIDKRLLDHEMSFTSLRDLTFGESARSMARKNARS